MNRISKVMGFAVLMVCALAALAPQTRVKNLSVSGPVGAGAWRDTLPYVLRWGKASNATSYRVNVTAVATPAGTTLGLPANAVVTDTTISFSATNLTYDSMSFTATVTALRGTQVSASSATKTWSVAKKPGTPGAIIVDSSAIPPVASVMTPSVRQVYAIIGGVSKLQWTSYDTSVVSSCGAKCTQITSWSCPAYPAGSPFGTQAPPGCYPGFAVPQSLTVWQRVKDWFSPDVGRASFTELVGRIG